MGFGSLFDMGRMASGAGSGSSFGPWGAAIGGGLGLLSGIGGGKDANKPQTTHTTQYMDPWGGQRGLDILGQILDMAQERYINRPPTYVGPSDQMGNIFNSMLNFQPPSQMRQGG